MNGEILTKPAAPSTMVNGISSIVLGAGRVTCVIVAIVSVTMIVSVRKVEALGTMDVKVR